MPVPEGPPLPLLLLHGWGTHAGVWEGLAAECPIVAADLPGYGGQPEVRPYRAETLARALAERFSTPLALCGWSMGGLAALAWAARVPDQIRALILVAATPAFRAGPDWPHGMSAETLAAFADDLAGDPEATLKRFFALQARGDRNERRVIGELRRRIAPSARADRRALALGLELLRDEDLRALAARVACPTLVLHGAADALCPPAAGAWLAEHIPKATLALRAGVGHAPFISDPAWFQAEVDAFLRHVDNR